MQTPHWKTGVPRAILLASDLSGRCDRALDRALLLAGQWQARLVVVTVVEATDEWSLRLELVNPPSWTRRESPARIAERSLRHHIGDTEVDVSVRIGEGHVGANLLRLAEEEGCSLIVTGLARNTLFDEMVSGSTVTWLVRRSPLPVLVVHQRPHQPYRSIVAATDYSPSSRHALEIAIDLFGAPLEMAVLHAFETSLLGQQMDQRREVAIENGRIVAREQGRQFLADTRLPQELRQRTSLVVEHGDPARLLHEYASDHECDLITLGTHGRSALYDILLGSVAKRILRRAQTDVLVVSEPKGRGGA